MCLAIPGEVMSITDRKAEVSFSGVLRTVDITMLEGVKVGDYVLVHAGCAIQIVPADEALETIELFAEVLAQNER